MGTQARVTSADALDSFRASLVIFSTKARQSVDSVRDRIHRLRIWLQTDQRMHWQNEIRRGRRALDQAQQELYSARLSGLADTVTVREIAVRKAKATVETAEEKLRNVVKWSRNLDVLADPLMKRLDAFREFIDHEMPEAIALLYRTREILDAYAERAPVGGKPADSDATPHGEPGP